MIRKTLLIAIAALFIAPAIPAKAAVTVTGAGSTWSQIALDQWRADAKNTGVLGSSSVNYQGVGSSAGRSFYIQGQVDFAVSEIPFEASEIQALQQAGKSYTYLPIVAGGTALMYNLKDSAGSEVRDLRLSSNTIAKIFTRKITNWSDPQITGDNGGRVLPSKNIVVVARSDGSGTSAQFSSYLLKRERDLWCAFMSGNGLGQCTYTSNWPQGQAAEGTIYQSGSDGVANYVASSGTGQGAITYVETGYALQRGRPVAAVKNASGSFALPTSKNVSVALTKATLNGDRTQNLDGVYTNPDPATYPISSYSYMIAPTKDLAAEKGDVLGKFMIYFACDGQRKADQLGYSPLPPNLVKAVFAAVQQVPNAPTPPPLNKCNNPTIQGGEGSVSDDTGDDLSSDGGDDGVISGEEPAGQEGGGPAGAGSGGGAGGTGSGAAGAAGGATTGGTTGGTAGRGTTGGTTGGTSATAGPQSTGGYTGGFAGGNGTTTQALPEVDLTSKPPSWLPLAFGGALLLLVVFVPPAFAIAGKKKRRGEL